MMVLYYQNVKDKGHRNISKSRFAGNDQGEVQLKRRKFRAGGHKKFSDKKPEIV